MQKGMLTGSGLTNWDKLAGVKKNGCPNLKGKIVGLLKQMQD